MPAGPVLSAQEIAELREIGDNTGSMLLKGASPDFEGDERADGWPLGPEERELAERFGIDPERDLRKAAA